MHIGYGVVASDVNEAGLSELVAMRPKIRVMRLDVSSAASISQVGQMRHSTVTTT